MTEYVVMPGAHYQDICNVLREKTGSTEPIRSGEIAGQIADLSGDNHYDAFWDNYQNNDGNYRYAFASPGWTDKTYNPKQPVVITKGTAEMTFIYSKITNTKVPIEIRVASAGMMFANCDLLKTIPYIGFFGVTNTGSIFSGCYELENVTFDGEITTGFGFGNCSKLTNASVQSYIDHLADLTGQTSPKVVFHANVGKQLTEVQKATFTTKNYTIVY